MPEIKIKHVASFSSEDKIHKAENILKSETYRKWKCATPGEKSASIVLQFEKAIQIHSIDIGNECSAFVEVLVGRSSDTIKDYQVLLVASSFMTPLESRNETHTNRVRMFGPDKLAQNLKDEKWDCVQVVCTQPFNKNITYGLSFIKFHSPPEKINEKLAESKVTNAVTKLGAFRIKYEDEDDDSSPSIGSWIDRKNKNSNGLSTNNEDSTFYAAAILASNNTTQQNNSVKRKLDSSRNLLSLLQKENSKDKKDVLDVKKTEIQKVLNQNTNDRPSTSNQQKKVNNKRPFNKIMERVVFVISGFVNPLRGEIRDKALEMGAKYKGDWDKSCTHLVCAFINTPKYIQVRKLGGRVVTKDWIIDCYKKKCLLDWKLYMLGSYTMDSSEESSEEETPPRKQIVKKASPKVNDKQSSNVKAVVKPTPKLPQSSSDSDSDDQSLLSTKNTKTEDTSSKKKSPQSLTLSKPQNSDSETADEDALEDYMAATDVDSDSEKDTGDEIQKVKRKEAMSFKKKDSVADESSSSQLSSKVDTSDLPLPELPNLFKKRHFFLYGTFSPQKYHDLQRYITAYNGVIEDYMSDTVKYVITESKWDQNFEEVLNNNEDLIFVKPDWIFKCHEVGKLLPYQPYIITPDS
ncbi:DNA repair protein XRCC1 [Trichonephila inaurata madagascariensis]|uniref:DNA repair protein XRCC1 n=1 Tax=Trichonephila inaurata madagascariensis TaxID=2747483 RepID=A0A8X7BZD4_9ARAC|nr:DNA repair protein XRCC1 [Trichonephila inaurata madagascariensis]